MIRLGLLARGLIVMVTIALLALSSSVTLGHVFAATRPAMAARLIPCNAVAKATDALTTAYSSEATQAEVMAARAQAVAALRCSPLISRALVVLALERLRNGDQQQSHLFLKQAERLSRRDLDAQLLLLEDAVVRRDVTETLVHYDTALRTNIAAAPVLFPTLATAIADPGLQPEILALLRTPPPWSEPFFVAAARQPAALPELPSIFAKLGDAYRPSDLLQRHVMKRLIATDNFGPAGTLLYQITGRTFPASERITSGNFTLSGEWPPFDWELLDGAGLGASLDNANAGLDVFSNGQSGVAAQQILSLPPGTFMIKTHAQATRDPNGYASWHVTCATKDKQTLAILTIPAVGDRVAVSKRFQVPVG